MVEDDSQHTHAKDLALEGVPGQVEWRISGAETGSVFDHSHVVNDRDLREAVKRQAGCAAQAMVAKWWLRHTTPWRRDGQVMI
jgi:hypothetical protein